MSTPGQVVIDSLNGKNSKGAAVVGSAVAVLGNGLLAPPPQPEL